MSDLPELPDDYLTFLESHKNEQPYSFEDEDWWLQRKEDLLESVNVDGHELTSIYQLQAYVATLKEVLDEEVTTDEEGNDYSLDRLENGLTIGYGNGDILYLDPEDGHAVWCFYHDGGDVERLSDSFTEWLEEAELDEDYVADDDDFDDDDDLDEDESDGDDVIEQSLEDEDDDDDWDDDDE